MPLTAAMTGLRPVRRERAPNPEAGMGLGVEDLLWVSHSGGLLALGVLE
jgi:hypothetical protein